MANKKLVNLDNLDKLSKSLDTRYKKKIQEESERAMSQEQILDTEINATKDMLGGKSIRYITQAEYDNLSESEKNSTTVAYFITDAEDLSHEHENKDFLDNLSARSIAIGNKVQTFDGAHDLSYSISDIGAAPASHTHDDRYYTETESNNKFAPKSHSHDNYATTSDLSTEVGKLNTAISKKSDSGHKHDDYLTKLEAEESFEGVDTSISNINTQITGLQTSLAGKSDKTHNHNDDYAPKSHNHDDIYYTDDEVDNLLAGKSDSGHNHNDKYYTESEIDKKITDLQAEIDADVKTEKERAMGVEDALQAAIDGKAPSSHNHDDRYYTETEMDGKLKTITDSISSNVSTLNSAIATAKSSAISESKSYTNTAIANLVDSAPEAMNTLNELAEAISNHKDDYEAYVSTVSSNIATAKAEAIAEAAKKDTALHTTISAEIDADVKVEKERAEAAENALQAAINKKSDDGHTHDGRYYTESEINTKLAGKADSSHGNHVPATQTASNKTFLRNDNTWATVTPANIGAAPSSHDHNSLYYTESEIDQKIEDVNETINTNVATLQANINGKAASGHNHNDDYAKGESISATLPATVGWYRVANSTTNQGAQLGLFVIKEKLGGSHSESIITAGTSHGKNPTLQQLAHTAYSTYSITKARLVYVDESSGTTAYLEVYLSKAQAVSISVDLLGNEGWELITPVAGSIPTNYASKELTFASNRIIANVTGSLSGNASSATKLQNARNIIIGNKTNSFNGTGDITYTLSDIGAAASGHTHDDRYYTETEINGKIEDINETINTNVATLNSAIAEKANSSHGTHLALGTTSSTAFRGDYGNTAYNHSQAAHAPSNAQKNSDITKAEIEAKLTGSITSHNHNGQYYTETEINTKIDNINETINTKEAALQASIDGKAPSSHNHTIVSMQGKNTKEGLELPSTYPEGVTYFFSSNPTNRFNNIQYGTVETIRELNSASAAWQFLYPYNARTDKFYVRNAQYNADEWREWAEVYTSLNKPTPADIGASASGHTHDDRYFTETEANNAFAPKSHNHDDRYYTETEVNGKIEDINETIAEKEAALQASINGKAPSSHGSHVAYGTCATAAATAAKVVSVSDTSWKLTTGCMVAVKFSATNSAGNVTLNVNSTGAYPIWYNNEAYTGNSNKYTGYANRVLTYMFNGTHWVWISGGTDDNTTYSNASLGQGYATCDTAESTVAKVGTLSNYSLAAGGVVSVKFTYKVPASATLNINSKGAKAIYFRGAAITANIIKAGDIATFMYDGSQYQLISIDRWQNDITSHNHDGRYYTETEINTKISDINNIIDSKEAALQASIDQVEGMLGGRSIKYVTQAQYNNLSAAEKESNTVTYFITDLSEEHDHNDLYYTKSQVDTAIAGVTVNSLQAAPKNHTHNQINSRGNVAPETANNRPAVSGLSMSQAYNNGYPTAYGNVMTMKGTGDGQLLIGWSGTSGAHAPAYIRSRRDQTDANWSEWAQIYTTANKPSCNDIGAAPKDNTIATVSVSGGKLTLTKDKRQKCTNIASGTQIVFPSVGNTEFLEIHLYFNSESDMSLVLPDNCKWRVDPNLEAGKSYELVATWNTMNWLANLIVYS